MKKKDSAKTSAKSGKGAKPAPEEAPRRGLGRTLFRGLYLGAAWLATGLFLLGLPMRLVGDDSDTLAILFYATPWAVLMVCGALASWYWRVRWKFALGLLGATLLCLGAWIWTAFRFPPEGRGKSDFRVAYWNCAHPDWTLRGILPMAASWNAEVMCFGESRSGALSPKWAEAFPNLRVQPLVRDMLLAGPESVELKSSGSLNGGGDFELCRAKLGGREVFLIVVDFDATPGKSRRPAFDRLCQLVDAYSTQPLIVMGDFNTPFDSVHFQRLRAKMTDTFDNAGSGLSATWPMLAPVLSLDHILVNKFLRVVRCEHHTSIYSDHRAVVAELAWR